MNITDRSLNKIGLTENFRINLNIGRQTGFKGLQVFLNFFSNSQGVDIGLFRYRENNGRFGIQRGIAHFNGTTCFYPGHIVYSDRFVVDRFNVGTTQLLHIRSAAYSAYQKLVAIVANDSARRIVTNRFTGSDKFLQRHIVKVHFHRIGHHLILLKIAANDANLRNTSGGQNQWLDIPLGNGTQGHQIGRVGFKSDKKYFAHDTRLRRQYRIANPNGHLVVNGNQFFTHNLPCPVNISSPVEIDPYKRKSLCGG